MRESYDVDLFNSYANGSKIQTWAYRVELLRWLNWTPADLEAVELADVVDAVLCFNSYNKAQAHIAKRRGKRGKR